MFFENFVKSMKDILKTFETNLKEGHKKHVRGSKECSCEACKVHMKFAKSLKKFYEMIGNYYEVKRSL
jgi:hypothetical protein